MAGCGNFQPFGFTTPTPCTIAQNSPAKLAEPAAPANGSDQADELTQRAKENAARVEKGLAAKGDGSRRLGARPDYGSMPPAGWEQPIEVVGGDSPAAPVVSARTAPAKPIVGANNPAASSATVANQPPRPAATAAIVPASVLVPPPMIADVSDVPPVLLASSPIVGLGGPNRPGPAARPGDPRTTTNTSISDMGSIPGKTPNQTLADAIVQAERLTAAQPTDFRLQLQLRMLYLAAGRTREAQSAWPAGSTTDQNTLSAWVATAVALEASRSPGAGGAAGAAGADPHEATLAALERLRQNLAELAALKVRSVKLASRVEGFGILTPFEGDVYRPGQWVIVYAELENLTSRLQTDGLYQSELSMRIEVLSAEGKSLLTQEDKQVVDRSLNQRRDFFLARRLRLPAEMTTGQYVLKVSVEDRLATKVGESMLRLQVK